MDYTEFRKTALLALKEKSKKESFSKEFIDRFKTELEKSEYYFIDGIDLYEEFKNRKAVNRYTLPYVLGFNDTYDLSKPIEIIQLEKSGSGGVDVDTDVDGEGRDIIIQYLKEKYGEDCVFPVGTLSMLGLKSAAKDLLRYFGASPSESNEFTALLNDELSFEDNIRALEATNKRMYHFYFEHKKVLDLVPKFCDKPRQMGKHAGGIVILDKPIYNYIPVERAGEGLVTAFQESGQSQQLDELGLTKYDLLAITALDNIKDTLELIDEELYLIEEDGIKKVVPKSYLIENGVDVE